MPARRHLIDKLFPFTGVHLIGGPSGAGKTRWLFQTIIDQWEKGKDVLGHKSHPCSWLYVAGDRLLDDAVDTLEDLGYDPNHIRMYGAIDEGNRNLGSIVNMAIGMQPRPELLVIEGLPFFYKGSFNDPGKVADFLTTLVQTGKAADMAVWGTCHQPKMKQDAYYENPRQRIMGSISWAACSGTIIMVEPVTHGSSEAESFRKLIVLPRRGGSIYVDLQFNTNGRLVEVEEGLNDALFDVFLRKYKPGETFKTSDANEALEGSMHRATIQRILDAAIAGGYVERTGVGIYRVKLVS